MKKILIVGFLVAGMSGETLCMGHPHNVFAARKHLKKQSAALVAKPNAASSTPWQSRVQVVKHTLCELFAVTVAHFHPVRLY